MVVPSEKMKTWGQGRGEVTLVTMSVRAAWRDMGLLLSTKMVWPRVWMADMPGVLGEVRVRGWWGAFTGVGEESCRTHYQSSTYL